MARSIIEKKDQEEKEEEEEEEEAKPKLKVNPKPKQLEEKEVRIVTESSFIINQLNYIVEQNKKILKGLKGAGVNLD